ncbi:MAG: VCBS repeat-containing protein, partial [Acidobacteriota bacterium]
MKAKKGFHLLLGVLLAGTALLAQSDQSSKSRSAPTAPIHFEDVSRQAGFNYGHGYSDGLTTDARKAIGGVAVGDFDQDGFLDLYIVRGDSGPNLLFRNRGDGSFEEVGQSAGLDLRDALGSGPTFADWDGDGWADLFIGGIEQTRPRLFRNRGDGTFQEVTEECGVSVEVDTFSAAFGDYDRDGDLDLFLTHWMGGRTEPAQVNHLWRNNGDGTFTAVQDEAAGLAIFQETDFSLTPNFADINNDGWPDLLVAADFGTSQVFLNRQDGTFENVTSDVISDENGMGAAIGDYDHDGDLDWFVSSIWDPEPGESLGWGTTGNRLYRNRGDGTFEDVTTPAGVREGYWGWGSCFADFDNDGNLDLFHVNGFFPPGRDGPRIGAVFSEDPSRLFMSNGDGTFRERSLELGLEDTGQGRGLVCFDYDRDGD